MKISLIENLITITFFQKINLFTIIISFFLIGCSNEADSYTSISENKIELGKSIFFDKNLSNPVGQACSTCHAQETGFSDIHNQAVSEGAVLNAFGNRNAPSLSYNIFSPQRYYNLEDKTFVGGLFLDGRSPNLIEQMIHPMLNPVEMNNVSIHEIAIKIKQATYFTNLTSIYGNFESDNQLIGYVADALVHYETSTEVNPFTSKYDYFLQGRATLTLEEKKGLVLFQGKGMCAECHVADPDPIQKKVLFTDFSYDNLGVPKNSTNPFYFQPITVNPSGLNYIDLGLGSIVAQTNQNGKFRVPTLRNIALSAPYFHNGSIQKLEKVVRFYNRRDLNTGEFAPPEVAENVNKTELGNLKMTDEEELYLVAFLKTLTDGYHKP